MVSEKSTYIDTNDGTMYAVNSVDDVEATLMRASKTTVSVDELEERVENGELVSPSELQEQVTDVLDGFNQALVLHIVSQLVAGEDPDDVEIPEALDKLMAEIRTERDEDDTAHGFQ